MSLSREINCYTLHSPLKYLRNALPSYTWEWHPPLNSINPCILVHSATVDWYASGLHTVRLPRPKYAPGLSNLKPVMAHLLKMYLVPYVSFYLVHYDQVVWGYLELSSTCSGTVRHIYCDHPCDRGKWPRYRGDGQ